VHWFDSVKIRVSEYPVSVGLRELETMGVTRLWEV
jgi:hypothetical protein